jgi:hypothetical protein
VAVTRTRTVTGRGEGGVEGGGTGGTGEMGEMGGGVGVRGHRGRRMLTPPGALGRNV